MCTHNLLCHNSFLLLRYLFTTSLLFQWANLENQVPPGVDTWDNIGTVNLKHLCRNRCMKQFVIFGNFKSHIVDTWQTVSKVGVHGMKQGVFSVYIGCQGDQ